MEGSSLKMCVGCIFLNLHVICLKSLCASADQLRLCSLSKGGLVKVTV